MTTAPADLPRRAFLVQSSRFPLLLPFLGLLGLTLVLQLTTLDLRLAGLFYSTDQAVWPWQNLPFWKAVDRYCVFPGLVLGVGSLIVATHGLIWRLKEHVYRAALVIGLVFLLGPGLLVNGSLKPTFSRPRPREVVELGGQVAYRPVLGFGDKLYRNSSFPSGHASIGFFLIAPAFTVLHNARWRRTLLLSGLAYGSLMGLSRMVRGGHFFSDVVWSLAILYGTAWVVSLIVFRHELRGAGPALSPASIGSTPVDSTRVDSTPVDQIAGASSTETATPSIGVTSTSRRRFHAA